MEKILSWVEMYCSSEEKFLKIYFGILIAKEFFSQKLYSGYDEETMILSNILSFSKPLCSIWKSCDLMSF